MSEILFAILIEAVFLVVLVFLLVIIVKRVNILLKNIFVDKLQQFDFLIEERESKSAELSQSIEEKQGELDALNEEILDLQEKKDEYHNMEVDIAMPGGADFEDGNVFEEYRRIKEGFNFDTIKILQEFLENLTEDRKREYEIYKKVREFFTHQVILKISAYQPEEQKLIVMQLLGPKQKEVLADILTDKKFNMGTFIRKMDSFIVENDPNITVYVGSLGINYDYLNKYIHTIYDSNITEGFKIVYQGKVYDYSI